MQSARQERIARFLLGYHAAVLRLSSRSGILPSLDNGGPGDVTPVRLPDFVRCHIPVTNLEETKADYPVPFIVPRRSRGQGSAVLTAPGGAVPLLDGVGCAEP
jgi:hypothetical protein